jgi:hypothetical protein
MLPRKMLAVRGEMIQPAGVQIPVLDFWAIEQLKQERFVTGASLDNDDAAL